MRNFLLLTGILNISLLASCTKQRVYSGVSALTIVNTVVNSNPLVTNFSAASNGKTTDTLVWNSSALQISYGSYSELSSYSSNTMLTLSQISDTLSYIWSGTLSLPIGTIHTFFLIGSDTSKIDTMFTTDVLPYYPAGDSVTGVRFVNVSPQSNPISVDILGSPNDVIVNNLPYKGVTPFQSLPATIVAQSNGYTFEFRDVTSGNVLASFQLTITLNKSQTLAFYGTTGSALNVLSINDY